MQGLKEGIFGLPLRDVPFKVRIIPPAVRIGTEPQKKRDTRNVAEGARSIQEMMTRRPKPRVEPQGGADKNDEHARLRDGREFPKGWFFEHALTNRFNLGYDGGHS